MNEELMNDPGIKSFVNAVNALKEMEESYFTEETISPILEAVEANFSTEQMNTAINQIIQNLDNQGITRAEANDSIIALKDFVNQLIYGDGLITGYKREVIDKIVEKIYQIFDKAFDKYHSYSIELPIKLEEGAQMPTYAHDSDAAADLYAYEDTHIAPETYGNKIRTGVSIQLPEGWVAMIFPRSSTGAKTTLRLSNSVGIIDSGYRGELGVLYDNTSVGTLDIKKGDRIAQLLVMPSYRFKGIQVEELENSDRGEGGFGSTGA